MAQTLRRDARGNFANERQVRYPHPEGTGELGRCRSWYIALGDSRSSNRCRLEPGSRLPVLGVRAARAKAAKLGSEHGVASFLGKRKTGHELDPWRGSLASGLGCNL